MKLPNLKEASMRNYNRNEITYKEDSDFKDFGMGKRYFIKTYGCQMNEHDTENICALLEQMGYLQTENMEESDLVLLNTCSIRENAHNKVFGFLGRVKHLKEKNPELTVGICGCMAQEESIVEHIMQNYKWVNFVFGTHNIHSLPKIIIESSKNKKQNIEVLSNSHNIVEGLPVKRESKYKAWVNIMYGCDKFCTYCIVPYVRGTQRSRTKESILFEVQTLIKEGYLEITLLGQNVNAYGLDLGYTFVDLLKEVAETSIKRVRFVTSHPFEFTDDLIDIISQYPNIMPYIHLPVQSGSNDVLRLMGRKYTRDEYIELYSKLKSKMPYSSITTDIIVGFPGETEEDFNLTLDIVNICQFDSAFTFIFSPRKGTPACKLKDDVPLEIKEKRLQILNGLINKYALEANQTYLDKIVPVLIEGSSKKTGLVMGYTDTMKLVNVKADSCTIGTIIDVRITDIKSFSLDGEHVKN